MFAWSKITGSPLHQKIIDEWTTLLNDSEKKESDYQLFISDHAGFFFPRNQDYNGNQLVLEKTCLGSDYITDFVNLLCNRSYGFGYTLIEIESPHDKLYTKSGTPSVAFNSALEQIRSWKRWISANMDTAKRIFPSKEFAITGIPSIKYMIIIGRREDGQEVLEKRNQIFRDEGIEVRSFDYLTDVIEFRSFYSHLWISNDFSFISEQDNNEFSSPFYKAIPDATWRKMLKEFLPNHSHMVGQNIKSILAHRMYNKDKKAEFISWISENGRNVIDEREKNLLKKT